MKCQRCRLRIRGQIAPVVLSRHSSLIKMSTRNKIEQPRPESASWTRRHINAPIQDRHTNYTQSRDQLATATFEFLPNLFRRGGPTPPQGKKPHCVRKKPSYTLLWTPQHHKFFRGSSAFTCMEIIKEQSASDQHWKNAYSGKPSPLQHQPPG